MTFLISISLSVLIAGTFLVLSVFLPQKILYDRPEFVTTLDTPNRRLETWIYYLTLGILSLTPLVFGIGIRFNTTGDKATENSTNTADTSINKQSLVDNNSILY